MYFPWCFHVSDWIFCIVADIAVEECCSATWTWLRNYSIMLLLRSKQVFFMHFFLLHAKYTWVPDFYAVFFIILYSTFITGWQWWILDVVYPPVKCDGDFLYFIILRHVLCGCDCTPWVYISKFLQRGVENLLKQNKAKSLNSRYGTENLGNNV